MTVSFPRLNDRNVNAFITKKISKLLTILIAYLLSAVTKTCHRAYADREGPDQPAHPRRLIWVFNVPYQNHLILENV